MQRTKIAGYILVAVAVLNTGVDLLDGNGFNFAAHVADLTTALSGAGLVFLRDAIAKIK
jgi:hypothetical protein